MTQDEARELVYYYQDHREEVDVMRREIGAAHPAMRYIEALEMRMPSWRRERLQVQGEASNGQSTPH